MDQNHWEHNCMYERGMILRGPDCHYCNDWDGLPISACTPEYDCCIDYPKTLLGRICNYFFMLRFNYYMRKAQRKEENELAKSSTTNRKVG